MVLVGLLCFLWLIFCIWFLCKGDDKNVVEDKIKERVKDIENKYPRAYKQFLINFDENAESLSSFLNKVASRSNTIWEQEEKQIEKQCALFDKYAKHLLEKQTEADNRKKLEEEEKKHKETEEKQRKQQEALRKKRMILGAAESNRWLMVKGIHHYFFYYYYPTKFDDVTELDWDVRYLIWDFKKGKRHDEVCEMLTTKLERVYGEALDLLTFVCVPASTHEVNYKRYYSFMADVCSATGMANGYEHITIVKEKEPTHLGGESKAEYAYDKDFLSGRQIILFDDVVTRGRSLARIKMELENIGAQIVAALSIGRTYSDYYGDIREQHPWIVENM